MNYNEQYRQMLKREFLHRTRVNQSYSLRAFSRDLKIQAPRLSSILLGNKGLSFATAATLCENLNWSNEEKEHFCDLVAACHARSARDRNLSQQRITKRLQTLSRFRTLTDDEFQIVSDWYYFSFLQLTLIKGFKTDPDWIASRLDIKKEEVTSLLECLIRMDLIEPVSFKAKTGHNINLDGTPSHAIRKYNKQILAKAMKAIDEQSVDERYLSTLTFAVPLSAIPAICKNISDFYTEIDKTVETHIKNNQADEVYCLATQFFRTTSGGRN